MAIEHWGDVYQALVYAEDRGWINMPAPMRNEGYVQHTSTLAEPYPKSFRYEGSYDAAWWATVLWEPYGVAIPNGPVQYYAADSRTTVPKPAWTKVVGWFDLWKKFGPYEAAVSWTSETAQTVDIVKARDIQRDIIRAEREAAWPAADVAWFEAMDAGDQTATTAAAGVRKKMRDAPAHASIANAADFDTLRAVTLATILAA